MGEIMDFLMITAFVVVVFFIVQGFVKAKVKK